MENQTSLRLPYLLFELLVCPYLSSTPRGGNHQAAICWMAPRASAPKAHLGTPLACDGSLAWPASTLGLTKCEYPLPLVNAFRVQLGYEEAVPLF